MGGFELLCATNGCGFGPLKEYKLRAIEGGWVDHSNEGKLSQGPEAGEYSRDIFSEAEGGGGKIS